MCLIIQQKVHSQSPKLKKPKQNQTLKSNKLKNKPVVLVLSYLVAGKNMFRDVSSCNTYDYGDAHYWDARYIQEGGSFDWYQRYSNLKPFLRHCFSLSSTILMVGCGNAGNNLPFSNSHFRTKQSLCFFYFLVWIIMMFN